METTWVFTTATIRHTRGRRPTRLGGRRRTISTASTFAIDGRTEEHCVKSRLSARTREMRTCDPLARLPPSRVPSPRSLLVRNKETFFFLCRASSVDSEVALSANVQQLPPPRRVQSIHPSRSPMEPKATAATTSFDSTVRILTDATTMPTDNTRRRRRRRVQGGCGGVHLNRAHHGHHRFVLCGRHHRRRRLVEETENCCRPDAQCHPPPRLRSTLLTADCGLIEPNRRRHGHDSTLN